MRQLLTSSYFSNYEFNIHWSLNYFTKLFCIKQLSIVRNTISYILCKLSIRGNCLTYSISNFLYSSRNSHTIWNTKKLQAFSFATSQRPNHLATLSVSHIVTELKYNHPTLMSTVFWLPYNIPTSSKALSHEITSTHL
jgi:hypothetical protein